KHDGLLLHHLVDGTEIITQARRPLEVESLRGGHHLCGELTGDLVGVPRHEGTETIDDLPVFLLAHPAHAGRGALVDISQQTRSPQVLMTVEHTLRAGTHG